jgi:hypothetical protein
LAVIGRFISHQGAVRVARSGGAESLAGSVRLRNIAAGDHPRQPQHYTRSTLFRRGGKMRVAASQKTIYNQLAKDGTR